jgi:hypothetical protein
MNLQRLRRALADPLARRLLGKVDSLHRFVMREIGTIEDDLRQYEEPEVLASVAALFKQLAEEVAHAARRLR